MTLRSMPEIQAFQHTDVLVFEPPEANVEAFDTGVKASDDDDATITIYGQIGIDPWSAVDNTERRISAALRKIGKRDVVVNLNSPGGNFFSGLAIYNLLRMHAAKITVNIIGQAGSAASVIAMAGDEIAMADGSFIMVHNSSALIVGNKYDAHDAHELMSEIDDAMANIYAARAGVEQKVAAEWMDKRRGDGTMFNAKSAIDNGLADIRLDGADIEVSAETKQDAPPERLVENALISAANMSPKDAKAYVSALKSGARDAANFVTRDADDEETMALLQGFTNSIRS